jgi:molecular chaperone DnaK
MASTIDFGIDLGTSNSAIAVQEGARTRLLPGAGGDGPSDVLLPSAIYVRGDGSFVVGAPALALRRTDPANSAVEFKRQMGTGETFAFPASGRSFAPEELSAEILRALAARADAGGGESLRAAVITVPAMFQLAQCEATRKAAHLAGIVHAPLLQEPIAAALAHSGSGRAREGHWLVYDLGGGTFDVSLVRSRAGRLQVLDHDGDNHLGGKDFNRVLARWAAEEVRRGGRLGEFRRNDPALADAFARLSVEAERVRIELSERDRADFAVDDLARDAGGEPVGVRLPIDRGLLESLIEPILLQTTALCSRLLSRNRLEPRELQGTVLVGGPTRTPCLAGLLGRELGLEAGHSLDPSTIVATGAALFASTQKLPAELRAGRRRPQGGDPVVHLQLEFESMTTNPSPPLVGRVEGGRADGLSVRVRRADGQYDSGAVAVGENASFVVPLRLRPKEINAFEVSAERRGEPLATEPASFTILHGLSVAKPPLAQSVGVMLADNSVRWYLRKGAVLPARNTVTHATTVPLQKGRSGVAIRVPLVQGESERADRNSIIGALCIEAEGISRDLPAGSEIEVTLTVDEFSRTTAKGYVPLLDATYDQIVSFRTENKDAEQVKLGLGEQVDRIKKLEELAAQLEGAGAVDGLDTRVKEVEELIGEGDRDSVELAGQMVRLMTLQVDGAEAGVRSERIKAAYDANLEEARRVLQADAEKAELASLDHEFRLAWDRGDLNVAESKAEAIHDLTMKALYKTTGFWKGMLSYLYGRFESLGMLNLIQKQLRDGVVAAEADNLDGLISACMQLLDMLPREERAKVSMPTGVVSGVI